MSFLISHREKDLTAKCIIRMEGNKTSITNLKVLLSSTRHSDCNSGSTCVLFNYFFLWFPKSSLKASQGSRRGIEPKPSRTTSPTTPWTVRAPPSSPRRRWVSAGLFVRLLVLFVLLRLEAVFSPESDQDIVVCICIRAARIWTNPQYQQV